MKKITWDEMCENMFEHNRQTRNNKKDVITAVVVYGQDNWLTKYSLKLSYSYLLSIRYRTIERSYRMSSDCCGFMPGKKSNAIYGDSLDGTEQGVRLDLYNNSVPSWVIDYCYME